MIGSVCNDWISLSLETEICWSSIGFITYMDIKFYLAGNDHTWFNGYVPTQAIVRFSWVISISSSNYIYIHHEKCHLLSDKRRQNIAYLDLIELVNA